MYKTPNIFFITILFSLFIFSSNAIAKACYEQSPNLTDSADDYYNLDDTVELSRQERSQLKSFFRNIKGKWKGELAYIECRGPDSAPRTITKNAAITAKASLISSEKISISAQKNYTKKRIRKQESFSLFNANNIYAVEFPSSNKLLFSERYRRANNFVSNAKPTKGKKTVAEAKKYKSPSEVKTKTQTTKSKTSRLIEVIYEVSFSTNSLTLIRSFYTNGVYTSEEKWSMSAD